MARWGGRALALATGALPAFAFPRPGIEALGFVGFVPALLWIRAAPSGRVAAGRAWLAGIGFFLVVDYWLSPDVGVFVPPVATLLGTFWIPWGVAVWMGLRAARLPGRLAGALLVVPAVWVATEFVRSWQGFGGPFGLLGASQWRAGPLLGLAALGGVWAVSFALMAGNAALALALAPGQRPAGRVAALLGGAAVLAAGVVYGAWRPQPAVTGTVRVAVVQPGVIHGAEARLRANETATAALAGARPGLVAWGESSAGLDPAADPAAMAGIVAAARAVGADVLAGVDARRGAGGIYKTALLVGPDGVRGHYDKMRLVPFGEYIPARPLLGWVARVTPAAAEDRRRGTGLVLLRTGGIRVGPLVCFESAFPDLSRRLAARGADLIVVQSATTTFQGTWGPDQHASLAAVRAVESGRPVVQAAVSGVSAAFDAHGHRLAWHPQTWRGAAVVSVPLTAGATPYVRYGDWLPTGSLAVGLAALLLGWLRRAGT